MLYSCRGRKSSIFNFPNLENGGQSDAWESVGILIPVSIVKMLSSKCQLVAPDPAIMYFLVTAHQRRKFIDQ